MPETLEQLFRSVTLTVTTTVDQPDPSGKNPARKQDYSLPWVGYSDWRDARVRLLHFEKTFKGEIVWAPFNDSTSNDAPKW
jgi:hypothetical protein